MAEEVKPTGLTPTEKIWATIGILFLAGLLIDRIQRLLVAYKYGTYQSIWTTLIGFVAAVLWPFLKIVAVIVSIFAIIGIAYSYSKLSAINYEEREIFGNVKVPNPDEEAVIIPQKNERWERVIELINSTNPSDWRLAIIEADIMLEDLLRAAGYHGESIGDMLKAVEKSDFTSIEAAWEAHKTRNSIAHRGGDFQINEREAKRAITLFERVFKEFKII